MKINTVLPTISSFSDLRPIVEQAEVKISFWGCRSVHVNGYEGSLSIDDLPERVFEIIRTRSDFSRNELSDGRVLEARITRLYDEETEVIKQSHFLTIGLVVITGIACGAVDVFSKSLSYFFYGTFTYSTRYSWDGEIGIGPISRLASGRA